MAKYLITVLGQTAIGKTAMAIAVAKHFNCEIVSCDSRQLYREMLIGTAVPDADELTAVPHHFIQSKSIFDTYTVGEFEKEAIAQIEALHIHNDYVVLVGGSGLYVDAVLKGFDDFPDVPYSVKNLVQSNYESEGITYLQRELKMRDPNHFSLIDSENPQRMMRAVEVSIATSRPYSSFLKQKKNTRAFAPILIGLEADRLVLYERINRRVDLMMQNGLLEEARKLLPHKRLNALQTVGYRELFAYFDGDISLECAVEEIKKNTRRFAKRQLTWFKRIENVNWFNYDIDADEIISAVERETLKQ